MDGVLVVDGYFETKTTADLKRSTTRAVARVRWVGAVAIRFVQSLTVDSPAGTNNVATLEYAPPPPLGHWEGCTSNARAELAGSKVDFSGVFVCGGLCPRAALVHCWCSRLSLFVVLASGEPAHGLFGVGESLSELVALACQGVVVEV